MSKPISQMSADEYKAFLLADPEAAEREATTNEPSVAYVAGAYVKADGSPAQPTNQPQTQQPVQQAKVYRNGQLVQGGPSTEFWQNGKLIQGRVSGGPGGKANSRPLI